MGRPIKEGMDYIALPSNLFGQAQSRWVISRGGPVCLLLYIGIYSDICAHSYYLRVDENRILDYSFLLHLSEKEIARMIQVLVDLKCFDAENYQKYRVLTSAEIQEYYLFVKSRRRKLAAFEIKKYKVNTDPDFQETGVCRAETPVCPAETPVCPSETPVCRAESAQRKVKESKVNESKGKSSFDNIALEQKIEDKNDQASLPNSFKAMCGKFREELLGNKDWVDQFVRLSGKGQSLISHIPGAFDLFESHVVTRAETHKITRLNHYARWFKSWWSCYGYLPAARIIDINKRSRPTPGAGGPSVVETAVNAGQRGAELALQILTQDNY